MPWQVVGADILVVNNRTHPCIVDFYRKFPEIKKVPGLSVDDLVHATKMTFVESGLPKKIISGVEANFTMETFKDFYRKLNV